MMKNLSASSSWPLSEQAARVALADEAAPAATRAVQNEHGVSHDPVRVRTGPPDRSIVEPDLRSNFAAVEPDIPGDEVALDGRRIRALRRSCPRKGAAQDRDEDDESHDDTLLADAAHAKACVARGTCVIGPSPAAGVT